MDKKYENGRTALHQASLSGHVLVAKVLLEFGADKDRSVSECLSVQYWISIVLCMHLNSARASHSVTACSIS